MPLVIAIPAYRGTEFADRIAFTAGTVYGADGNDRITLLGTGRAFGGSDNDTFFMGNRAEQLAYGGFGDDFFSVTGTGALQSFIKGGVGVDTVLLRGQMSATVTDDAGAGNIRSVDVVLSYAGGMTLNVSADDLAITAQGTLANVVNISGDHVKVILADGNDRVTVLGEDNLVNTGGGDDFLNVRGASGLLPAYVTGTGNDMAILRGQGVLSMGAGNDRLTYFGGEAAMGGSISAGMGSGNDRVVSNFYAALDGGINLGSGADRIVFRGTLEAGTDIVTGTGADTLVFRMATAEGGLFISDFDVVRDRLDLGAYGVDGVADVTRVTQSGADALVFIADGTDPLAPGLELRLGNTLVSQITDAIFV